MPHHAARAEPAEAAVVTKATLRAADRLDVSNKALARILGLSEASVSRMGAARFMLTPGGKPYEIGVLFIRLYRGLDAIVQGDDAVARAWLTNHNTALGGVPLALIQTLPGLMNAVAYLDARRALL